ncbi:MAG: serine--tRNA ligase, partial [Aphanocapsa feldmannii 277cI]
MLDQRLVRNQPDTVAALLRRRGMEVDLSGLQTIASRQRDLEEHRSGLQAEGNRTGRAVAALIRTGARPDSDAVTALREQGNAIKRQVAQLEQEEHQLDAALRQQLLAYPNL